MSGAGGGAADDEWPAVAEDLTGVAVLDGLDDDVVGAADVTAAGVSSEADGLTDAEGAPEVVDVAVQPPTRSTAATTSQPTSGFPRTTATLADGDWQPAQVW